MKNIHILLIKDIGEDMQNNWKKLLSLRRFAIYAVFAVGNFLLVKRKEGTSKSLFSHKYSVEL